MVQNDNPPVLLHFCARYLIKMSTRNNPQIVLTFYIYSWSLQAISRWHIWSVSRLLEVGVYYNRGPDTPIWAHVLRFSFCLASAHQYSLLRCREASTIISAMSGVLAKHPSIIWFITIAHKISACCAFILLWTLFMCCSMSVRPFRHAMS